MRRILYGGSFDPVHAGHLHVAAHALALLGADRLSFVPAASSPLKPDGPRAPAEDRLAMVRLAAATDPRFDVLDVEIARGGRSYTFDTVRALLDGPCKGESLMLLLGADALRDLPRWHRARELAALVPIAAAARPGVTEPDWGELGRALGADAMNGLRARILRIPPNPVSSTAVRRRIAEGKSVRCWVPDPVADYIEAKRLYLPAA